MQYVYMKIDTNYLLFSSLVVPASGMGVIRKPLSERFINIIITEKINIIECGLNQAFLSRATFLLTAR